MRCAGTNTGKVYYKMPKMRSALSPKGVGLFSLLGVVGQGSRRTKRKVRCLPCGKRQSWKIVYVYCCGSVLRYARGKFGMSPRLSGEIETDHGFFNNHSEKTVVSTLVERKSLYTVIRAVLRKMAQAVRHAVVDGLTPYIDWVHTITYDNGREFADHEGMASDLDARIYFAHPYASRERGLNENTNGLIRQYFPKDRDLTTVTKREIEKAMDKLNHRPRKSLGYRTPYEVFFNTWTSLTVKLHS